MSLPIYIAGPTAVGKSEIALWLAQQLRGEIISVDSMQVYRGLDIGSAKPSLAEQRSVPHHLIDVAGLAETFDAAQFLRLAEAAEEAIFNRGSQPIYCGGTGLYFKALASGIGDGAPANPELRRTLESKDLPELVAQLCALDPQAAATIDLANRRRVVRAIEKLLQSPENPLAQTRSDWSAQRPGLWIGLGRDRAELYARINQRVDSMFAAGLVEETRLLLLDGLEQNLTAMQAIGYRQVVEHLRGARSLEQTIELVKQKTRNFAKRQMTWFERQLRLHWIQIAPGQSAEAIGSQIIAQLGVMRNELTNS